MACLRIRAGVASGQSSFRRDLDPTEGGPGLTASWAFDGGRLEVSADRLGLIPIFHATGDDGIVVGDSLLEVASHLAAPALDAPAVAAYLALGFYLGDDTPLAGVKALGPGATLEWEGLRLTLNAPGIPTAPRQTVSRAEAVERYGELFGRSMARRAFAGSCVALSGGRDSRHILLELARQRATPDVAVIASRPGSTDREVGLNLAGRLGLRVIEAGPCRITWEGERAKNRQNDFLSDENLWYATIAAALPDGVVHDGLGGDVLSNGLFFDRQAAELLALGRCDAAAARLVGRIGAAPTYLTAAAAVGRRAIERIAGELRRHAGAPAPLASFLFWNRTRREIALMPARMLPPRAQATLPYLDDELVAFLLGLPFEEFGARGFHDEAIAARFPDFADLPYAGKTPVGRGRLSLSALREWRCAAATPCVSRAQIARSLAGLLGAWSDDALAWWWRRLLPLVQLEGELRARGKRLEVGALAS